MACPGCRAADALVERDAQTPVPALIWPDHEQCLGDGAVEARPVIIIERVMQLPGDRRHRGNPVVFAVEQGVDVLEDRVVVRSAAGCCGC